ncbi:MAG TPA: hypothetical protein PKZ37_14775 [Gallionellaceae bacterium]|jgi:hypothetical protein|nr:hypothetical protein [Gallionellaceae bacterium]
MPITFIQPIPVGNALRIFITPPFGAKKWRLLRNANGIFSGYNDLGASVIHEGKDLVVLDSSALTNGQVYHYGLFWFNGTTWAADGTNYATPNPTMAQLGPDVLSLIRDRLDEGLAVFVGRGELHHKQGHIQVLTAPPLFEDTIWPVVTVHLQSDSSAERALGEDFGSSISDAGLTVDYEGWLSKYQLLIVVWCLNPDERNILRRAVKNLLIANLPVFDKAGMVQIDVTQSDTEDFQSFSAPVYQSMTTLSCLAPSIIGGTDYLTNVGSVVMPPAVV